MKKKLAVLVLLFALMLPCRCLASSVQIHPPWGQDGDKLYVSAFGKDRYFIVKTRTSAAINAAIDALGAEGGEIYCPEGSYDITGQITIDYSNTTISGAGDSTIFVQNYDGKGIYTTKNNILLRNFVYDGADYAITLANDFLIDFYNTTGCVIEGVTFKRYEQAALNFYLSSGSNSAWGKALNCVFKDATDNTSTAIWSAQIVSVASTLYVDNCEFNNIDQAIHTEYIKPIISNSRFYDCEDSVIIMSNSKGGLVSNCHFYYCYGGIGSASSYNCAITNCTFENHRQCAITMGSYWSVVGNTFLNPDNLTYIIYAGPVAVHGAIIGNIFNIEANDADYIIYLDRISNMSILNNDFDADVDVAAIYSNATCSNNIFFGNQNISFAGTTGDLGEYTATSQLVEFKPKRIDREVKTNSYVITAQDLGKSISMNSADDKTFSLPSVGSSDDGSIVILDKIGAGKLTIDAADSDYIFDSGAGDGIYSISSYASIVLEYHDTDTRWYIKHAVGTWVTYD